ncbi:MAG TPA: amidase [Pelomicrobium sp.]|nr:amidase [Pelomicrobium sp.]
MDAPATRAALGAVALRDAIATGLVSTEQAVTDCLERIRDVDASVEAWAFLGPEHVLEQARALDEHRRQGRPLGRLHGVPVAIKDIIDVRGMPTGDGTVLHEGRIPRQDAALIRRLRADGAIVLGKTVTTELATYAPGKTRNPHNPAHTPGGSSSGSAAAVASYMAPLAVGTQTNGSVIRPAAYCGVYGYKPTFGMIPRSGVLRQSRPLDQVGVMGRSIEDIALIAETLTGYDEDDPATQLTARPPLLETSRQEVPLEPRFAFIKAPAWDRTSPDTQEAFAELVEHLGGSVTEVELPATFLQAVAWHKTIMEADLARSFAQEYDEGRDKLSASLRGQIERGREVRAVDYLNCVDRIPLLNRVLDEIFGEYHAILTPATLGTAPRFEEGTGDPIYCTLWTLCGTPALTLPLLQGENGMPLGVQLVGQRMDDARLLRTARWLEKSVRSA